CVEGGTGGDIAIGGCLDAEHELVDGDGAVAVAVAGARRRRYAEQGDGELELADADDVGDRNLPRARFRCVDLAGAERHRVGIRAARVDGAGGRVVIDEQIEVVDSVGG